MKRHAAAAAIAVALGPCLLGTGSIMVRARTLAGLSRRETVQSAAVCESQYSWMSNQVGQTPCLAWAWIYSPCSVNSTWHFNDISDLASHSLLADIQINALPNNDSSYNTPTDSSATTCFWYDLPVSSSKGCLITSLTAVHGVHTIYCRPVKYVRVLRL